jgi:hypothetical protein
MASLDGVSSDVKQTTGNAVGSLLGFVVQRTHVLISSVKVDSKRNTMSKFERLLVTVMERSAL